jgi:type II secretory pathway pseudopilin PulG
MLIPKKKLLNSGQSVIEVIVAVSILVIIASSVVASLLGSFSATRLAEEENQAINLAKEGLDAASSIRNQDWQNLIPGSYGLKNTSGYWELATLPDLNYNHKFTRTIAIAEVKRDGSGQVVDLGGSNDPDTRKITATVNWNFTAGRHNKVTLTSYLTDWQAGKKTIMVVEPTPSVTITPTITPTVTPSPTPTTAPNTCATYCVSLGGYTNGVCRKDVRTCTQSGGVHQSGGDPYCTGGPNADTCCCN